jgi:DNA repair exonuclease SbcCD nuclease subunit
VLKIIHTGDIHIGKKFNFLHESIREEYRARIQQGFFRLIKFAKEKEVDAIVICGDLFNSNCPDERDVKFVFDLFSTMPNIKIYIVPGEFDYLGIDNLYNIGRMPKNVYVFRNGSDSYEINKKDINILAVYGRENENSQITNKIFKKDEVSKIGFDYAALGKDHDYKSILSIGSTVMAAYCGSLVSMNFEDSKNKGFIYMEMDKNRSNFEFIELDIETFDRLEIDVTSCQEQDEIIDKIRTSIGSGVYEVILTGEMNVDSYINEDDLLEEINNIRILDIKDKTKIRYFDEDIYIPHTAKSIFVQSILENINNGQADENLYKKVLKYGLNAMESKRSIL